jgi:hypothetical protein
MNLWAKRTGQLLVGAVLFFLLSCEDDSFLLGIKGKPKFQGRYQEIKFDGLKSSVLLLDSVFTDQYAISASPANAHAYRYLIGSYTDPAYGVVNAEFFAQYLPNDDPDRPVYFNPTGEPLTLDSTTVQLLLDFYAYGPEETIAEVVNLYPLIKNTPDTLSFFKRYFNYSTLNYDPVSVGQLKIKKFSRKYSGSSKFRPYNFTNTRYEEQADRSPEDRDTIMLQGKLDEEFAFRVFDWIVSRGDTALTADDSVTAFRKQWPGLAFIPTENDGGRVIGINPLNAFTRFTFHYHHTNTQDSLTTSLYFTPFPSVVASGFTTIKTQRTGGLNGISVPNQPYYPNNDPNSSERYIQDGSTVITELDLSDYYSFIDTLEDIIINSAEISLEVQSAPAGMPPPSSLYAMLMKKTPDNKIVPLDMRVDEDSLKWRHYVGNAFTDLTSFVISTELSGTSPLALSYDKNTDRYVGHATLFFQLMFNNKDKPELMIEHLGLYPATAPILQVIISPLTGGFATVPRLKSGIGNVVNRAVLKTSGMKLKLYYTIPNKPNLE